jgi:hypothetical protein
MKKSLTNSQNPEVSVIIASYNTRDLTLSCIDSLLRGLDAPSSEIIIVDNNSADDSVDSIRSKFPGVIVLKNPSNLGFAVANNQGARVARSQHLLFLNSDTQIVPGAIGKMVNYLEKHPKVAVLGPRLLNSDKSVQPSCFHTPGIINTIRGYWLGKNDLVEIFAPRENKPCLVNAVVGAAMMLPKPAFQKLGGFDEKYFFFFEDLDLCLRARHLGLKVAYLPSAKIIHLHGASRSPKQTFGYLKESLLYPYKKAFGLWHPSTTQEYLVESSIHYFGWWRHLIITLIIKYPAKL